MGRNDAGGRAARPGGSLWEAQSASVANNITAVGVHVCVCVQVQVVKGRWVVVMVMVHVYICRVLVGLAQLGVLVGRGTGGAVAYRAGRKGATFSVDAD